MNEMNTQVEFSETPAGTFAYLEVTNLTEKVARAFLTERAGAYYLDVFGKGSCEESAKVHLVKKVKTEIARLEAKNDPREEYKLRLEVLRSFVGG